MPYMIMHDCACAYEKLALFVYAAAAAAAFAAGHESERARERSFTTCHLSIYNHISDKMDR